jgi:hypothetical protein
VRVWLIGALVLILSGGAARPALAASYDDPFFLGWTSFLPEVPGDFTATTENNCPKGSFKCVDNVVKEMTRRWEQLACDHNGPFSFVYLITTMQYREAAHMEGFFDDVEFVNHEDAVFADYYFEAYDDWTHNRMDQVPPAWRVAFHAAESGSVTGYGDMILGMNAHINRDLPFVLNAIGLTAPDGTSRKADHDKVDDFLNEAGKIAMGKAAQIYDAAIDDSDMLFTTLDNTLTLSLIEEWREEAWRKAEMLRDAPTLADKLDVARYIEEEAAMKAQMFYEQNKYNGITNGSTGPRDAYCSQQWPSAGDHLNLDPVATEDPISGLL